MKKHLLLGAAFAAMAFTASADLIVQDIPNADPLRLDGDYAAFHLDPANAPQPDADGNVAEKSYITYVEPDAKGNPEYWKIENDKPGDYVEFKLNNTLESPYVLHVDMASKIAGATVTFEIIDANGDTEWSGDVVLPGTSKAWDAFAETLLFITDPITTGAKTFKINFVAPEGKNVANIRNIVFEDIEEIVTYSLYTNVNDENGGSVSVSPSQTQYLEGTEIVLTAAPAMGWKFVKWVDEVYGDEYTENPYTFSIMDTSEFTAYFEELKMDSDMPGFVNLETRTSGSGKLETKGGQQLDGESYMDGAEVYNLGDYRNGQFEEFDLNFTTAGEFTFMVAASTKMNYDNYPEANPNIDFKLYDQAALDFDPSVAPEWEWNLNLKGYELNNWTKYTTYSDAAGNITEGKKVLRITFNEPDGEKKYTCNILRLGFGLDENWWAEEEGGVEGVAADAMNGEVRAYNLQGIQVSPDTKGLIIVNGVKVYNK